MNAARPLYFLQRVRNSIRSAVFAKRPSAARAVVQVTARMALAAARKTGAQVVSTGPHAGAAKNLFWFLSSPHRDDRSTAGSAIPHKNARVIIRLRGAANQVA